LTIRKPLHYDGRLLLEGVFLEHRNCRDVRDIPAGEGGENGEAFLSGGKANAFLNGSHNSKKEGQTWLKRKSGLSTP
jgi:hypothetical protein